jgi:hypothetical protein
MIAIGVFVVLVALGLVWWSQAQSRDFAEAQSHAQCLRDVSREEPVAVARRDLDRGEDRPFFQATPASHAPGIAGCSAGGAYTDNRPWPFARPQGDDCAEAESRWVRAYNAELARLDPMVSAKYCGRALPQ